jgi:hypothetical protein
VRHGLLSGKG